MQVWEEEKYWTEQIHKRIHSQFISVFLLLTVHKSVYSSCSLCHWRGCLRCPAQCYIFMRSRPTTWKERRWVWIIYPMCIFSVEFMAALSTWYMKQWVFRFFPWTFSVSFTYVACWIGERTFLHLTFDLVYYVLVTGFPPNYVSHFSAFDWVYYVIHTGFPPDFVSQSPALSWWWASLV